MAKGRAKRAATKKQHPTKRKRNAAGKKTAIAKALESAKRKARRKKAGITQALTDAKRTAAAKWAWVTRQLNSKRA